MSSSMFSYLVLWLPLWLSTKFSLLDQVPLLARISRKPAQPWNRPNSSRQRAPRAPLVWPLPSWSPFLWWLQSLVVLASWPTVKSKLGKYSSLFNWISTVSSQHPSTGSERLLQRNRWSLVSIKQLWFQGISSVIYYYSCLYYYLLWVPILCILLLQTRHCIFTSPLYPPLFLRVSNIISGELPTLLGCTLHIRVKTHNPISNPPTTCNEGFVGALRLRSNWPPDAVD